MQRGIWFVGPVKSLAANARYASLVIALALLVVFYALAVGAVWNKSITFDEHVHLAQGFLRLSRPACPQPSMNGTVAQRLAGLPLFLAGVKPPDVSSPRFNQRDQFWQARAVHYESGNDPVAMLRMGRMAVALLGVAAGFLVFLWARDLFGEAGGLLALLAFVFNPVILSNAPLVTADTAGALGFLAATWSFWRGSHRATPVSVLLAAGGLGLLMTGKMSGIVIVPVLGLLMLIRSLAGPPVLVAAGGRERVFTGFLQRLGVLSSIGAMQVACVVGLLWIFYRFPYFHDDNRQSIAAAVAAPEFSLFSIGGLKLWFCDLLFKARFLPETFVHGLASTLVVTGEAPAFLDGRHSMQGFVGFFPYAFLVKTPVGLLFLFASGVGLAVWRGLKAGEQATNGRTVLYGMIPLFVLFGVYGATALSTGMNIGVRHILPLYPVVCIFAGGCLPVAGFGRRFWRWAVGAGATLLVLATLAVYPHELAFFNFIAGGPQQGYRRLVDSSLDWGQDLPTLKAWLDRNRLPGEEVYLSYFGTGLPEVYGLEPRPLPCHFDWGSHELFPLTPGLYCVSATMLQSVYSPFFGAWKPHYERIYRETLAEIGQLAAIPEGREREAVIALKGAEYFQQLLGLFREARFARLCHYLRRREPDASAGYSILIFRLDAEEIRAAMEAPARN